MEGGAMSSNEYQDLYAICNHMSGAERVLRVGGKVTCPETNWSAHLEPTQGNTGINPLMLHLDLILERPEGGAEEVVTLTPIEEWRQENPTIEYEEVEIHRSDGGSPPPVITVDHVH
jgi:hypothetical protein